MIEAIGPTGLVLDPWQEWFLVNALGERGDGKWASFAVGLNVCRQNGKGSVEEARELGGLFVLEETEMIHTAHRFNTCRKAWERILRRIEANPDFDRRVAKTPAAHGEEAIILRPVPSIILGPGASQVRESRTPVLQFLARSSSSARGFTGDLVIYDEAMILAAEAVAASLPTLSARMMFTPGGPQVWYAGSAGLGSVSSQWARVRARGITGGTALCYAEYSITVCDEYCDPGCAEHDDPYTPESVAKANPGLGLIHSDGTGLTLEAVQRDRDEMDEPTYLREHLGVGVYPVPEDGWSVIPKNWYLRTAMNDTDHERPAGPCFGIDSSPRREWSAIGLAGDRSDDRTGVELADHRPGTGWLVGRAVELDRRWSPCGWVVDPHSAGGTTITDLQAAGLTVHTMTATDVGHAFGQIYDAFRDDRLRHPSDKEVQTALAGASTRRVGAGLSWDRITAAVDLTPVVAVTFALWGLRRFGGDSYDIADSVHFDLAEITRLCRMGVYGEHDIARLYSLGLITAEGLTVLAANGIRVPALR